jgi:glycine cleavage system T protein (aminomethyltransferase)
VGVREEVYAIRHSVAVCRMDHMRSVRVRGANVYEALDGIVPADLYVRDGQILQSLLLDESGRTFADIYLGCDDEEFLILAEGPTGGELSAHLERHLAPGGGIAIEDQSTSHGILALDGPYAWELLALLAGPDVVGLPYLTLFHLDRWICLRAGKTGEYGYVLIVPREDLEGLYARLLELGAVLDASAANLEALDQCALENWYFNIRREGMEPVTPIELQLQWRVSYRKSYVGSEALMRRRREGPRQRLTCLVSGEPLLLGSQVSLNGRTVGRVVNPGFSSIRGDWVALGLLEIAWAHPGIDLFQVEIDGSAVAARSVTPPLLNNRSLHVSPQIHSYAARHEFNFPSLRRR